MWLVIYQTYQKAQKVLHVEKKIVTLPENEIHSSVTYLNTCWTGHTNSSFKSSQHKIDGIGENKNIKYPRPQFLPNINFLSKLNNSDAEKNKVSTLES